MKITANDRKSGNLYLILGWIVVLMLFASADIGRVKRSYAKDLAKLEREYAVKIAKLRAKYLKSATAGKVNATRAGKLELALEWREWESTLGKPSLNGRNLSKTATLFVSSEDQRGGRKYLCDGIVPKGVPIHDRRFWYPAASPGKEGWWVRFEWKRPVVVTGVRFVCPTEKWHGANEPTEYRIECLVGNKVVGVREFKKHAKAEEIEDGFAVMVTAPIAPVRCDRLRFVITKATGTTRGGGPVIWEMEVIGK